MTRIQSSPVHLPSPIFRLTRGAKISPPPPGIVFAAGLAIGFGVGIAVASWNHWGWGWHNWGMGWGGGSRTVIYQRNVYVSRSVTVVNHGYYGHFDRNPEARVYNRNMAARAPNYHPVNYNNRPNNNYDRHENYNRPNNNERPAYNNNYHPAPNNNNPQDTELADARRQREADNQQPRAG